MISMPPIFVITGTPGTGKSTLARLISKETNIKLFEINSVIIENELYDEWDEIRDVPMINDKKIIDYFSNWVKNFLDDVKILAEGHYFEFIPSQIVTKIIILRANPPTLKARLKNRNFKPAKINENVQAEILGNIMGVILQNYSNIPLLQVDTSEFDIEKSKNLILDFMNDKVKSTKSEKYIDWLLILEEKKELEKYF